MNKYVSSLLFVIVLGSVTSLLLLGADFLTEERIIANEEALLKSKILDANEISYTFQNIHDVFDEEIVIYEEESYVMYQSKSTNNISYQFVGNGVWGEIIGIITLEDDFKTIVEISILQQEETPGLGGVVAERAYLDQFNGKTFDPSIVISKTANTTLSNEIDSITGATRTSEAFEGILNNSYEEYKAIYEGGDFS